MTGLTRYIHYPINKSERTFLLQQNVEAQAVNPAFTSLYYPYHSTLGFDKPHYLSTETDQQLLAIASRYNIKPAHMYELYSMLNSYSFLTIEQDLAILNRVAALMERKRQQYGIVYPAYGNVRSHFLVD